MKVSITLSALLIAGTSFDARSSAVNTIGPELDGPVGLSSSHAGAPRASARAKIANRRIGISFNEDLVLSRTLGTCATPGVPQPAPEAPVRDYCLPDTADPRKP